MRRTDSATVSAATSATSFLKREDCKRTKHDSDFSQWKILIGPSDWEDYLLNKEGAERYRTQNLPNRASCSGLYELGIAVSIPHSRREGSSKLSSNRVVPVYLGQADNVRTRLQQYGRDGAHLENGCLNGDPKDCKRLGLFSTIFSKGFAIAYRWAPMESKKDAEKTESQLLRTFDYAWNRGMNRERRPSDIYQKLDRATSSARRLPLVLKKLKIRPREVGLRIKRCEQPVLENGSNYTKQVGNGILSRIFKFSRSRPISVSKEFDVIDSDASTCGVALGQGSICTRPPVEGRKRCINHKGMKVNAFVRPSPLNGLEDIHPLPCGVTLDDGSLCTKEPAAGRKRCVEHKARRIHGSVSVSFLVKIKNHHVYDDEKPIVSDTYKSSSGVQNNIGTICGVDLENGTFCMKQPVLGRKRCKDHKGMRINRNKS